MDNKPFKKVPCIAGALLAVAAVAVSGMLLTDTQSQWYRGLANPAFEPSGMIFPIVWAAMYVLIALSLVRLLTLPEKVNRSIWILYALIGLFNVLWTFVFYQMHLPALAFAVALALAAGSVFLLRAVWRADGMGGWLLVPYLIWLAFVTIRNYVTVMIN